MDALPFIVFAIRRYCCILFTAKHLKIYSPKVRSNQKLRFCPLDKARAAGRAERTVKGLNAVSGQNTRF